VAQSVSCGRHASRPRAGAASWNDVALLAASSSNGSTTSRRGDQRQPDATVRYRPQSQSLLMSVAGRFAAPAVIGRATTRPAKQRQQLRRCSLSRWSANRQQGFK